MKIREASADCPVENGWVIEKGDSETCEPLYWRGAAVDADHVDPWTKDNGLAIRFARHTDARVVHFHLFPHIDVRICEHQWDEPHDPPPSAGGRTMRKLQPIETAPKDGTPILAVEPAVDENIWAVVAWQYEQWAVQAAHGFYIVPTHWQPLPAPPIPIDMER